MGEIPISLGGLAMPEFDLIIKDGNIVTASDTYTADIGLLDGTINTIAKNLEPGASRGAALR